MRSAAIALLSLVLTIIVVGNAYYQKKQFYPSVVYITKSNPSMAIIYGQAFVLVLLMGKLMKKVFFGQLRAAEFEHLLERSWYAVTETCLAFTVFRDDFSPKFVALFTVLLFLKSFHWLAEDRVDFMERSPVISPLFHLRVISLLTMLGALDLHFVGHAYHSTITKGASVQLVFGFEYAILMTIVANIAIKYALHTIEVNSETPWDNKAVFLLYTELIMGFLKVILYTVFVAIMVRIYTLPLFAFRPMYYTMRAFKKAFNDVILSRRAIRNMNTLYPDATAEELAAADNVCIICREEMVTASKKLPCNHIFHTSCLRSWFQRQQTCPTCRLNILRTPSAQPAAPPPPQQPPQPQPPAGMNVFQPMMGPANGFQGVFPFWQPVQAPVQQPQEQPQPAAPQDAGNQQNDQQQGSSSQSGSNTGSGNTSANSSGGASGTSSSTSSQQTPPQQPADSQQPPGFPPGANFPMFYPPFPFMPFAVPPPIPSSDFSGLTTEELERMEGTARENVEARLQCLRNIQLLLDASVLMMLQYTAAAMASSNTETAAAGDTSKQGVGLSSKTAGVKPKTSEEISIPSTSGVSAEESSSASKDSIPQGKESNLSTNIPSRENIASVMETNSEENLVVNQEYEELRRRRLQKFGNAAQEAD